MLTETDSRVSGFIYPSEVEVRLVLSPQAVVSHLHQTQRLKHQRRQTVSGVWTQVRRYLQVLGRLHVQPRDVLDQLVDLVHHRMLVRSEPGAERTEKTRSHRRGHENGTNRRTARRRKRGGRGNDRQFLKQLLYEKKLHLQSFTADVCVVTAS